MSPIERFMHHHPTTFAALVLLPIAVLVWWLTSDNGPIEAVRSTGGL